MHYKFTPVLKARSFPQVDKPFPPKPLPLLRWIPLTLPHLSLWSFCCVRQPIPWWDPGTALLDAVALLLTHYSINIPRKRIVELEGVAVFCLADMQCCCTTVKGCCRVQAFWMCCPCSSCAHRADFSYLMLRTHIQAHCWKCCCWEWQKAHLNIFLLKSKLDWKAYLIDLREK